MSDFTARVVAKLNTSDVEKQLKALSTREYPVKVKLEIDDINGFSTNIVKQLSKSGKSISLSGTNIGKQFGESISKSASNAVSHSLSRTMKNSISKNGVNQLIKQLEIKNVDSSVIRSMTKELGSLDIQIDKASASFRKLKNGTDALSKINISGIDKFGRTINTVMSYSAKNKGFNTISTVAENYASASKKIESSISKIKSNFETLKYETILGNANAKLSKYDTSDVWVQKATDSYNKASQAVSKLAGSFNNSKFDLPDEEVIKQAENIDKAIQKMQNSLKSVSANSPKKMVDAVKPIEVDYESTADKFKNSMKQAIGIFSGVSLFHEGIQGAKAMVQAVRDVDTAMVELRKVSTASDVEISNYFETASQNARDLGATISDVILATADFSRQGFILKEADALGKAATIYKNVGDNIDIETAGQSIISTLKGFKLEASEAMHVVDAFNEVSNTNPISSGGIGEALQRSASSLSAAGNTLEESIGMITSANAVVQDPAAVGERLADFKSGYIG